MEKRIFVHGSGHKAASWDETISYMENSGDALRPDLAAILNGKEATYANLSACFAEYCNKIGESVHLCGISLGGMLALSYALDFPEKVKTLVLIGTPHKVPKIMFGIQNVIFKLLPKSAFAGMAFGKEDTFALGNSMKKWDVGDRAGNIQCRTLVVCGKKDSANLKSAYYFAEAVKHAQLRIMENAGHIVNEESPRALAKLLDEFYCAQA